MAKKIKQKLLKRFTRIVEIILVAALINVMVLVGWVMAAPRNVTFLGPMLQNNYNRSSQNHIIKLGSTLLKWEGWQGGIGIHLNNIQLLNKSGATLVTFPEARLTLQLPRLLLGQLKFRSLELVNPSIHIDISQAENAESKNPAPQAEQDFKTFYSQGQLKVAEYARKMLGLAGDNPFQLVKLTQANLILDNGYKEIPLFIEKAEFGWQGINRLRVFQASAKGMLEKTPFELESKGTMKNRRNIQYEGSLKNIRPNVLIDVLPSPYAWMNNADAALDINWDMELNLKRGIQSLQAKVNEVSKAAYPFIDIDFKTHREYEGKRNVPEVKGFVQFRDVPFKKLKTYWPNHVFSDAKDWVTNHIYAGELSHLKATLALSPQGYVQENLPEDFLTLEMLFQGLEVHYHEALPPLKSGKGTATLTHKAMNILLEDGTIASSRVQQAQLKILGLDKGQETMEVGGNIAGPAADLLPFFALKPKTEGFTVKSISGNANTDFFTSFPLLKALSVSEVVFDASAQLNDFSMPNIQPGIDLARGSMLMKTDNDSTSIHGEGELNGVFANIEYNSSSKGEAYHIAMPKVNTQQLTGFGLPEITYLKGDIVLDVASEAAALTRIKADLKNAALEITPLGLVKPQGQEGEIDISAQQKDNTWLAELSLKAPDIHIAGKAEIENTSKALVSLDLNQVRFPKTSGTLKVKRLPANGYDITVKAERLDAGPLLRYWSESDTRGEDIPFNLNLDIAALTLANNIFVTNAKANVKCGVVKCPSALVDLPGVLKLTIGSKNGSRSLNIKSENAGALLAGLDFSNKIKGGVLSIQGQYDDAKPVPLLAGNFQLLDYQIGNAPILAKLLTLGSLTGIVNLLQGQGISFNKAGGKFTFQDSLLILSDTKTSGSAIGITLEGQANLKKEQMIFTGNIVPAYGINSIAGNVPILGKVLTGGEGQGIIATRYKVEGNFEDPSVSVNPLSMLTPGFLRNIWGTDAPTLKE